MVNHFGKKPPMMPPSNTAGGVKSRNVGQKSIADRASASYNVKVNRVSIETIDEELNSREAKERPLQVAAENIMNIDRKITKKIPFGHTGALTPDNLRAPRKLNQQYNASQSRLPL